MPPLTIWFLRTALVSLLAGAAVGGWLLAGAPLAGATHPRLREAHVTLLLFGWLLPFVLGTGYWMLPRHAGIHPRGSEVLTWFAAGCYGVGLVLRLAGGLVSPTAGAAGTVVLLLGTGGFILLFWTRVKPFGAGRTAG